MRRRGWLLCCVAVATITIADVAEIPVEEQFFRSPPKDSFVAEGARAIMPCVIGNLGGRVQWTKDGLIMGFHRSLPGFRRYSVVGSHESGVYNLQILNATIDDEATYECQVGPNGTKRAIRANGRLKVLLPPTRAELVNHSPGSVLQVKEGGEVNLTCVVHNAKPRPDILWYKGDAEFVDAQRQDRDDPGTLKLRTTVTSTIKFRPSFDYNNEEIACEAQHPALLTGPLRTSVTLSVQYPPGRPEIEGYTEGSVLKAGESVSLVCISQGGNPLAVITWYKNGKRVDSSYTTMGQASKNTYTFVAKPDDNNAKYTCMAKNELMDKELLASVTTKVYFAPETVRINGPSEAKAGDELHFECITSNSNPMATVWWVVDGKQIKSNDKDTNIMASPDGGWISMANITVNVETRDTTKIVQCHAIVHELEETRVESHTVSILYPPGPPVILGYKNGETLRGGQTHKIMCTSHGGNPLAMVRWFDNDREVESDYEVGNMDATATLVLLANMTDNGATYRCLVSNKASPDPQEKKIKLNVNFAPPFVRIEVSPKRPRSGGIAELTCHSGEANPTATIEWLYNGKRLSGRQTTIPGSYGGKKTKNSLILDMKPNFDGRVYTCKALNKIGEAVDAVTLSVAYKPAFSNRTNPIEIIEGLPYLVNVTASGNPSKLDYRWTDPAGVQITSLSGFTIWANRGVLNISRATRDMAGTYTVRANNTEGGSQTNIKLDVLYSPKITDITSYIMVSLGESAQLDCTINANPVKYDGIRWEREDLSGSRVQLVDSQDGVKVTKVASGGNSVTSILVVHNVSVAWAGKIWCVASNNIGSEVREETYLLVKYKPVIDKSPVLSKAAAASRGVGSLVCRATGAPNITFTWRRQTGDLAVGSKYNLTTRMLDPLTWESRFEVKDVNPADYGVYECSARNTEGTTRHRVMLDAPSRPDPPRLVTTTNVTSNTVKLDWSPGFNGGSLQSFRVKYEQVKPTPQRKHPSVADIYPLNITSFTIHGLSPNTQYVVAVMALNSVGESDYSKPVSVITSRGRTQSNQPLVDGLTDTTSQTIPVIVTVSVGVCGTLLLLLSVVLVSCLIHKRRMKATASRSVSMDSTKSVGVKSDGLFSGSQGSGHSVHTSCYNDTMSEETMSSISEKSGSFMSSPQEAALRNIGLPQILNECYHPHAASTYLTEHVGGIYSVEQGREISFTSKNLPLSKNDHTITKTNWEDTESQYADELRRQAYIQTLGDGYNISQVGSSSLSYPNSPTAEFYQNSNNIAESDLGDENMSHHHHHHHISRPGHNSIIGPSATLGRHSGRYNRKSPFQVVMPKLSTPPPVCSTPQDNGPVPLLGPPGISSNNRTIPEFTTFGNIHQNGQVSLIEQSEDSLEPSGHLV